MRLLVHRACGPETRFYHRRQAAGTPPMQGFRPSNFSDGQTHERSLFVGEQGEEQIFGGKVCFATALDIPFTVK